MNTLYINNILVTKKLVIAQSFFQRLKGLMFRRHMDFDVLMIKPCNSIHTYFMRMNIDVIFLDHEFRVIQKNSNLKKNRVIMPVQNGISVLEGPAFYFQNVTIGDRIGID